MAITTFPRLVAVFLAISGNICQGRSIEDEDLMHPVPEASARILSKAPETQAIDWMTRGQDALNAALNRQQITGPARNVVFFIGDGMGVSTLTAARFFKAQRQGTHIADTKLSWEDLAYTGISKTYNTDYQTPDSAGTATAFLSGEKTRSGTIGLNQNVPRGNCTATAGNEVTSLVHHAMTEGKWSGIISTARITHATPASAYAHSPDRNWEDDSEVWDDGADPEQCWDIARQLVWSSPNSNIRVLLGGGRRHMMPNDTADPEYPREMGRRLDGRDLRQDWLDIHSNMALPDGAYKYVEKKDDFDAVDPSQVEFLMGLFEDSHMKYEADREEENGTGWSEPSLREMVQKSLDILERGPNGYVLFVEGGRIDHGHHANNPHRALMDTLALDDAVQLVMNQTNPDDTLIVVTADHSHVFTIAGYQGLETDILGIVEDPYFGIQLGDDDKPMTTLSYGNGPGYIVHRTVGLQEEVPRKNLTSVDTTGKGFVMDAAVPLGSETHGGEDVAVYARGPMAHLLIGQQEQSYLAHGIMYAQCVGPNKDLCANPPTTVPSNDPKCGSVGTSSTLAENLMATIVLVVISLWNNLSSLL